MKLSEFITIAKAAERLGVTTGRLRQLCSQDRIPGAVKVAGAWFVPRKVRVLVGGRAGELPTKIKMVKSA